jgi:hypothetical protein
MNQSLEAQHDSSPHGAFLVRESLRPAGPFDLIPKIDSNINWAALR